jgi:flagellar biosynthesis protein FlhF
MPQDVTDAYAALTAAEVSPDLAREIVQAAGTRLSGSRVPPLRSPAAGQVSEIPAGKSRGGAFQRALMEELESRFTTDATLGTGPSTPRIVALVGPPGSGKTTTLVKLAVNYGLAARRGVMLLSTDTHRVAAADQLRAYAAILGVGFHVLETIGALSQTIEESRGKELIFLDTPGLTSGEVAGEAGLAHFLSTRADVDTHLVLPASMKPADLSRVVDAFGILKPRHLLFTRLDETESCGPIFNEAARTAKPLSFFATGQRIPEDLETAGRERLLDLILAGRGGKARSAA